jgi:hypothetical protein
MADTYRLWQRIRNSNYVKEKRKYFGYEATRTSRSTRWMWGYHSDEYEVFVYFLFDNFLAYPCILTVETVRSFETSVNLHWTIYRHISYHSTILDDLSENLKSSVFSFILVSLFCSLFFCFFFLRVFLFIPLLPSFLLSFVSFLLFPFIFLY